MTRWLRIVVMVLLPYLPAGAAEPLPLLTGGDFDEPLPATYDTLSLTLAPLAEDALLDRGPEDPEGVPERVTLVVRPETVFSFNGADSIPEGLFGFHDVALLENVGGNPLRVAAGYEVVRAAMWTPHRRHIPILNTEANDPDASEADRAVYNIAHFLRLINTQPDLAKGRALRAMWNGYLNRPDERDARLLMAPLRGRILDSLADASRLTAAAAHPGPGRVVVVGVDHGFGDVEVRIPMPRAFRVGELTLLLTDTPKEELRIRNVDGAGMPEIPEGGTRLVNVLPKLKDGFLEFSMPERSAFRLTLLNPGYEPSRTRDQNFQILPVLFHELKEGETLDIGLERELDPDRTFLRSVYTGNLELVYGDRTRPLPGNAGRPGDARLTTVEVPPAAISASPRLRAGPGGALVMSFGWVWEG